MDQQLLSLLIAVPVVGAALVALAGPGAVRSMRAIALTASLAVFAVALRIAALFDSSTGEFQFTEQAAWIPQMGVTWSLGLDGISLLLVLLTVFLTPLVVLNSATSIDKRQKGYLVNVLLLESAMLGTLVATDVLVFYVFWELMLVPMFLLIGIWGGRRRVYASMKFVLFTMVGSLPMLVALVWLGLAHAGATGAPSYAMTDLYDLELTRSAQAWCFAAMALSFAIKVPMWPLHTWLPDAHVEAPTGGSVILAGVLLKMGTYGFLRLAMPICPDVLGTAMPIIGALAVVGIIYGALVAMVQPDMKKLVAYSSVSHLGFVMLGLSSLNVVGVEGAVYQMISHGISTGALFLLVGVLYERRHTRLIADFGGLWRQVPLYAFFLLVVTLSSIGLPGLNGFVGEFLILLGAFKASPVLAILASSGVVLGAVYMLWMFQRVMFGEIDKAENREISDLNRRELVILVPLLALIVLMGVYPRPFLKTMEASVELTLERAGITPVETARVEVSR